MFRKLWNDEDGIVAFEYLLVATIVGLGLTVGLSHLRDQLVDELVELSNAIGALSQDYSYNGIQVCGSSVGGSQGIDNPERHDTRTVAPDSQSVDTSACP